MQIDFSLLEPSLQHLQSGDRADVRRGFEFAVRAHALQQREDGTPYVLHVIEVARTVAEWGADRDTIIAALLHDALEDTPTEKEELVRQFGRRVAFLVEGITKFTQADLSPDLPLDRKIETLRKLFDVMRLDIRSILIKLADRVHNVQTIDALPTEERRKRFAIETLSIYYKIAFHLGMRDVIRVFAEYCVPHAFPEGAAQRMERDRLCVEGEALRMKVEHDLRTSHGTHGIVSVSLLPRNLLIFHDRIVQHGGVSLMQDAFSIGITVRTEEDCYQLLKSLHTLYRPVSGHFRDFIAAPSDAGYQSLHTHVTLPLGTVIECRIRTPHMFEQMKKGITLSMFGTGQVVPNFAWLNRSASLDLKTRDSSSAFWEAIESDVLRESSSITVDQKRLSLPNGSTALDAAYALYDAKAGFVKSITVNGRAVPLGETLKEDDDVHSTTDSSEQVTFEWLQMVSTQHARLLIVDVLKRKDRSEKTAFGAVLLQKELDHYHKGLLQDLSRIQCVRAAQHFRREKFNDVLVMIGEGVMRARDVVFYLFPDHQRLLPVTHSRYKFRLNLNGTQLRKNDIFSQLNGVIRLSEVSVDRTSLDFNSANGNFDLLLTGSCDDRLQFADFVELLERQAWVLRVQTLISRKQKLLLIGAFALAFAVVVLDIVLFPAYEQALGSLSLVPQFLIQAIPLIPILAANYYLLRLLRQYVARMRSDRWFLGIGLLLNVIGLLTLVLRIVILHRITSSLLPLIAIFTASLFYMGIKFFQNEELFKPFDDRRIKPIGDRQWLALRRRKIIGYFIRLGAVVIWGLEPIYIRYTSVNALSPFIRTFLLAFGVLAVSSLVLLFRQLVFKRERKPLRSFLTLPYDKFFVLLVIGQIGFMYLKNASLVHTTGTNLLLFNNFAPLLGLLVAAVFWRRDIPYLKRPQTMLWIFLLAIIAGIGSSLLVYSSVTEGTSSLLGDILAFIATLFDVLLVVSQIQYIKGFPKSDPAALNLHIFFYLLVFVSPLIILAALFHWPIFAGMTITAVLLGIGIGLFEGVGQMCNYAAFKRIDGYLAHLMFNLSVFITFSVETFVLHTVQPTLLLIVSGLLILSASVLAEYLNSQCQKKGL